MSDMQDKDSKTQIEAVAREIIESAENAVIMDCRYLQYALAAVKWVPVTGSARIACNGQTVYYDPALVIRRFKLDQNSCIRCCIHILFHLVFHHNFEYESKNKEIWDLACDVAVENIIMELDLYRTAQRDDPERRIKLDLLKSRAGGLHAQALYRLMLVEEPSEREREDLIRLFKRDEHELWLPSEKLEISLEEWKRISERVKSDLKSFSGGKTDSESLRAALDDATREKINYSDFLRRFMVSQETIKTSDDEFDYIYYTYGLDHYRNMPLIEPLEYSDATKVKEFVIALDTSASVRGDLVEAFLNRTVSILSDANNFFNEYHVHIVQCDSDIRSDTIVHNNAELQDFIANAAITGYGSTDFRPVFEYIDDLCAKGVFLNLRGILYFTDGYGIFPRSAPAYDTAFVFVSDDGTGPDVPDWAIRIVLDEDQIKN